MFSKILVKLIDHAIIPAILLVSVRIVSVILVGNHFGIEFTLGHAGFEYFSQRDYIFVNSYSTFFMIATLALGLLYILVKSFVFHESHISPALTARLFSLKLPAFIQNSFDLYSQGAIWLSYLYLLTFVSAAMVFFGLIYSWVFYTSLTISVLATTLLVLDIEHELNVSKLDSREKTDIEDLLLNYGDDYA